MSYTHQHTPLLDPREGYNRLGSDYKQYHKALTERDKAAIEKYLPRSLHGLSVLDIGWGDGRRAKQLKAGGIARYTILDTAAELLKQSPARIERLEADILEPFPVASASYDLLLCTFVLLHLPILTNALEEARRVVTLDGRMLLVHHQERRPRVHTSVGRPFKIQTRHRTFEQIEEALDFAGRDADEFTVDESTKLYCCFPRTYYTTASS